MPGLNGLDVTKELAKHPPSPAVVICSVETNPEIIEAAQRAGALGYVFKKRIAKELIVAVKSVARGQSFVSAA
jgi:DNA-binding NarL/FixJ family response regulator